MSKIHYTVRVEGHEYEASVDVPPGPICARCGHELCPCCETWCDVVGEDGVCLCFYEAGGCVVDENARKAWIAENDRRKNLACFGGSGNAFEF